MEKTRVGVIGCGNISDLYFMNLTERYGSEIEVVACADLYLERAQASAAKWGFKAMTVEDLLKEESIEIVVNLTIPAAHTVVNRQILEAGKHCYCEKPLALSFEDAKEIVALAESKGLLIGCAPDTFLGAGFQTSRKLIDEGWLGKLVCGVANMVCPGHEIWHPAPTFYYQKGGGPMMDMGPYYMTALVSILGPIKQISAFCCKGRDMRTITSKPLRGTEKAKVAVEMPTTYQGIVEFESGICVNVIMSFDIWNSELPRMEIHGTEGSMYCSDPDNFMGPVYLTRGESIVDQFADLDTANFGVAGKNPFDYSELSKEMPLVQNDPRKKTRGLGVVDLAHAIRDGRKPRISHELILHVIEALCAFEKSSDAREIYKMTTTCERPAPIPVGLGLNCID